VLVSERLQRHVADAAARLHGGAVASAQELAVFRGAALLALWDTHRDRIQKIVDTDGVDVPFLDDFVATYHRLRLDHPLLQIPEPRHVLALMYQWRRNVFYIAKLIRGRSAPAVAARMAIFQASMGGNRCVYARKLYLSMERIPVLITGETGTGKDLAAKCIGWGQYIPLHEKEARFVIRHRGASHARNLSEVSRELIEAALFGHKRGSFTGATADAPGFFALPEPHESLFLDEIGELPEHVQAKLLRPLENREIVPVGEQRPRPIHGRYIFGTNKDLEAMCHAGAFRSDLLERMNGVRIHMPPLRQMLAEDPRELEHFVRGFVAAELHDDPDAEAWVQRIVGHIVEEMPGHPWSRNLRELKHFAERYLVTDGQMPRPQGVAPAPAAPAMRVSTAAAQVSPAEVQVSPAAVQVSPAEVQVAMVAAPAVRVSTAAMRVSTVPTVRVPAAAVRAAVAAAQAARSVEEEPAEHNVPVSVCVPSSGYFGIEAKKGKLPVGVLLRAYVTEVYLANGLSLAKTAEITGLHRQTVRKLIDHARVARRLARRRQESKGDK
jgi:DNA-binding NtrC family response regulator